MEKDHGWIHTLLEEVRRMPAGFIFGPRKVLNQMQMPQGTCNAMLIGISRLNMPILSHIIFTPSCIRPPLLSGGERAHAPAHLPRAAQARDGVQGHGHARAGVELNHTSKFDV